MSFTDDFLKELEKKKKKIDNTRVTSPYSGESGRLSSEKETQNTGRNSKSSTGDSFTDSFFDALGDYDLPVFEEEDDIAPLPSERGNRESGGGRGGKFGDPSKMSEKEKRINYLKVEIGEIEDLLGNNDSIGKQILSFNWLKDIVDGISGVDGSGRQALRDLLDEYKSELASLEKPEESQDEKKDEWYEGWLKGGAFSDGYQVGDVANTALATVGDTALGVAQGFGNMYEGITDFILQGGSEAADWVGLDSVSDYLEKGANKQTINTLVNSIKGDYIRDNTIWGEKGQSIPQGVGNILGMIYGGKALGGAGLGTKGVSIGTSVGMGASSAGSGISDAKSEGIATHEYATQMVQELDIAFDDGRLTKEQYDAAIKKLDEQLNGQLDEALKGSTVTDTEAWSYGTMKGVIDAVTELFFGGLGKGVEAVGISRGIGGLDDIFAKKASEKLAKHITNKYAKRIVVNGTEYIIKAGGEGLEEVLATYGDAFAKWLSYMSDEELSELIDHEEALEAFISSFVSSGITQGGGLVSSIKGDTDYVTGYTDNEQAVIDKEIEKRITEQEKNGKKLSESEKKKITEAVKEDLDKGYISIDTIEEVLGGDSYKSYQDTVKNEDALKSEFEELEKVKTNDATLGQSSRYNELKNKLAELETTSQRSILERKYKDDAYEVAKGSRLESSYFERARGGEAFTADLSKYDEKQRATIQSAIDAGFLNNRGRTHDFVNLIAKIAADKGVTFDFLNNEKLKTSGFAVDGAIVNGYYDKKSGTVGINLNSDKALNTVVGHEITHVLEGTEIYNELQTALINYAKAKGDYQGRVDALSKLYDAKDIDSELTADLVGDYLFTDADFVNRLSTEHRNVFQKVFDEIKYLYKTATAGSKEARELEKVKRVFEEAYRTNVKGQTEAQSDVKHSLSENGEVNFGYHAGDLGKAEGYWNMVSSNRGTGHFGTGTYFVGDEKQISDGTYGNRPHEKVDFSNYKMFKPLGENEGFELHSALKYINDNISQYPIARMSFEEVYDIRKKADDAEYDLYFRDDATEAEKAEAQRTLDSLKEQFESIGYDPNTWDSEKLYSELKEIRDDYRSAVTHLSGIFSYRQDNGRLSVDDTRAKIDSILQNVYDEVSHIEDAYAARYEDSPSTRFMKAMGYEGIDVRGMKGLDNTKYGSVIYDLKGDDLARKKEIGTAKYSLSKDSDGNALSDGQKEFFKDSKAVDRDGNLLKVYHTTNSDFTVFDDSKKGSTTGAYNSYLGHFFTNDPEYMSEFPEFEGGKTEAYYLNMKNPIDMNNISREAFLDIVEVTGGDVTEAAEIYDSEYEAEVERAKLRNGTPALDLSRLLEELTGEYFFDTEFHDALRPNYDKLIAKGYDGVINNMDGAGWANEYVVLNSNQAKLVTNKNPTSDPDTRYSLSSIANTFFGDENMSANEFMRMDYRETQGYKDYVDQCLNNFRQTRTNYNENKARGEIEDSIAGIVRVAVAAKQAGYDIYDDATKRDVRDSKNRLLFSSLEPNSDYFTSNDISTECDKRKNFAEIYDAIVKKEEAMGVPRGERFFDNVDNYFYIHKVLADKGLTQPCRECYVESMRKNLAPMANAFIKLVGETDVNNTANEQLYNISGKDKGKLKANNAETREKVREILDSYGETADFLTVEMLTTEDGLAELKITKPEIYEAFNSFYGQSKPKLPRAATPFRFGELTALLTDNNGKIKQSLVNKINSTGGFRLQSYSDFQVENYTDTLQVLFEAGTLGLRGHAYTKVPAFLDATEGTNLKRNISIFMYKDGNEWKLDRNDSFPYTLEEIYDIVNADEQGNTGIIAVSQNDDMSAWIMANDNVGYGIPFHKSGLKMDTVRSTDVKTEDGRIVKGYSGTKDHTKQQTEVWAKASADHKALTKVKKGISIYELNEWGARSWDFNNKSNLPKNKLIEKNVKAYIDACEKAGYLPKFRDYVRNNGKVLNDVLKYSKELGYVSQDATIEDISFKYKGYTIPYGYYKFLGDFGMFKPDGTVSPHEVLSLKNYDFDKAVAFFEDTESLHRNEILQQFANGVEREKYRNSNLTAGELRDIVKQKRNEIADGIVSGEIGPTKRSLSAEGEPSREFGSYNVYGRDVMLQDDIAPVETAQEPVTESAEIHPDDYAPMSEDEAAMVENEALSSLTDEDAPPVVDMPYYEQRDTATIDDKSLKGISERASEYLGLGRTERAVLEGIIQKYSQDENVTRDQLYSEIRDKFSVLEDSTPNEDVIQIKKDLRSMRIYVSDEVKADFGDGREDGYSKFLRSNFGRLRLVKDIETGVPVDSAYEELSDLYPSYFPEDIINPADQLRKISEMASAESNDVLPVELSDEEIQRVADMVYSDITGYMNDSRLEAATEASHIPLDDDLAPVPEEDALLGQERSMLLEDYESKKADIQKLIDDKNGFISKRANELYWELSGLKKGVRASKELGYLLDQGYSWGELKTALVNTKLHPDSRVREDSAIESIVREALNEEYENLAYEIDEIDSEYNEKVQKLETDAKAKNKVLSVREVYEQKLANHRNSLAALEAGKEKSLANFNEAIGKKLNEYNSLKNKNTKRANTLLQQMENLRLRRDNVQADYANRIAKQQARLEAFESKSYEEFEQKELAVRRRDNHKRIVDGIKARFTEQGYDLDEVFDKAKNLSTFATVDNTPQRVMEKSLGYKEGQILSDLTVDQVARNESEGIKWLNSVTNKKDGLLAQLVKKYGIKPGSKASAAAQMYAEGFFVDTNGDVIKYGDAELAKDFPNEQVRQNIIGLARDQRVRQFYDETLDKINESRARNAYPEIQKLDNYFLHFRAMEDTFSRLGLPFNPNDIKAKDLPTDLNGVTADLKPGQPYFASARHREGIRTSHDLLGGLERYASSAKNQIYHIDDIQTLRAIRNYIADGYGQAKGLESLDSLTEEEAQEKIKQVYGSHLSTFAKFLNEEANVIAGKTALIDRGLEGIIGRRGITLIDTINKQVGANMVGFNVSSSLTNFIPVAQTFAKSNKFDFTKAFAQTASNKINSIFGRSDEFIDNNPTVLRRRGADRFYQTPYQKVGDIGYTLMGVVDDISTELIVRTKYNEYIRKGMSEQDAVNAADKWTSRLMADRSLGQMPQIYNSRMLGLFTKFQLEVRNQLDAQFYDTIQEKKVSNEDIENGLLRNAKTAAQVTSTFAQLAIAQHLYGMAFEAIAGYNPAFDIVSVLATALGFDDDEDDEDTVLDNLGQGFLELLEDLPYTSALTGGGRIPISSALPVEDVLTAISGQDANGNEISRKDAWKTVGEAAPYYFMPGGYGQLKKTIKGMEMFDEDLPIAGSYTDSGKLRYPVDDTVKNRLQAAIFGQYANENAGKYFDGGHKALDEKQIQEFIDVDIPIEDYWDYREGLYALNKESETGTASLAEKIDYIMSLDLPIEKKNLLANNLTERKEPIDLTGYEEYGNYKDFDFAKKYPEKYAFLQDHNISVSEYEEFDEDTKEAYTWASKNPAKYKVSKAISDDLLTYRSYTDALYDIKADKDEDGKSISGSRKEKVINYINNLDADYGQKIILFKSEYPTDDTYNYEIIDYLNGRDDISYSDMVTILTELGFKVEGDNVYWD